MSELIKRKDAIKLVKRAMEEGLIPTYYLGLAPTTDAVNVVRCKECKYWIGHIADDDGFDGEDECRWRDSEAPNADDYCSYGERKESE